MKEYLFFLTRVTHSAFHVPTFGRGNGYKANLLEGKQQGRFSDRRQLTQAVREGERDGEGGRDGAECGCLKGQ